MNLYSLFASNVYSYYSLIIKMKPCLRPDARFQDWCKQGSLYGFIYGSDVTSRHQTVSSISNIGSIEKKSRGNFQVFQKN